MYVVLQFLLYLCALREALQISHWHLSFIISQAEQRFLALSNVFSNSLHKVNICLLPCLSVHRMALIRLLTYKLCTHDLLSLMEECWIIDFHWLLINCCDSYKQLACTSQWTNIMSVKKYVYILYMLYILFIYLYTLMLIHIYIFIYIYIL